MGFFGKHYAIERFGVVFIILAVMMTALTGSIVYKKKKADKEFLTNQVIYTGTMTMSKSSTTAKVVSCFTDKTHTKCFLLWKFASSDMSSLSIDANDYQLFLMGSNKNLDYHTDLNTNRPAGIFYLFGQTGYMGVYLQNSEPWTSQVLHLVLRNNKDYTGKEFDESAFFDPTAAQWDRGSIYFNPGGGDVVHADFLDAEKLDLMKMYKEAVVYGRERDAKQVLHDDLNDMAIAKRKADEFLHRLTSGQNGAALVDPGLPLIIANDKLIPKHGDKELHWDDASNKWLDDDGKGYKSNQFVFYYEPTEVLPGGYDFNWQDTSIDDGWLDNLRGNMSEEAYLSMQKEKSQAESNFDPTVEWAYTDGSIFTPVNPNTDDDLVDPTVVSLSRDVDKYYEYLRKYYNLKYKYEISDMPTLLYLEREVNNVLSSYSVNTDDDVVMLY